MADEREAPLRIINSGVSGDRIRDVRRRWQQDCLAHQPDIVTILIGVNDTWRRFDAGETTSAEQYTEDYQAILGSAVAAGVTQLVVMEPFLVPPSRPSSMLGPLRRGASPAPGRFGRGRPRGGVDQS